MGYHSLSYLILYRCQAKSNESTRPIWLMLQPPPPPATPLPEETLPTAAAAGQKPLHVKTGCPLVVGPQTRCISRFLKPGASTTLASTEPNARAVQLAVTFKGVRSYLSR